MSDSQVANELVRRGIISSDELRHNSIGQILVNRGIISANELNQGKSIFEIVRGRGII